MEPVQRGRSLPVEVSKTFVNVHWNSHRSVYLHGMSQRNGSAGINCSNKRFRGGVVGSPLSDHIEGVFRCPDAYWRSIGRLLLGRLTLIEAGNVSLFDETGM